MSKEGGDVGEMPENHIEDALNPPKVLSQLNHGSNGNLALGNGLCDGSQCSSDTQDLLQMVIELTFQNEFFKSQFEGFRNFQLVPSVSNEQKGSELEGAKELQERIESLNSQLLEEKQTRSAAEEALKHLQTSYSEAEAKTQELSEKLIEGQIYM